jgi:hypothetical protein
MSVCYTIDTEIIDMNVPVVSYIKYPGIGRIELTRQYSFKDNTTHWVRITSLTIKKRLNFYIKDFETGEWVEHNIDLSRNIDIDLVPKDKDLELVIYGPGSIGFYDAAVKIDLKPDGKYDLRLINHKEWKEMNFGQNNTIISIKQ